MTEQVIIDNSLVGFDQLFMELKIRCKNNISLSNFIVAVENLDSCSLIIISKDRTTKELFFTLPPLFKSYLLKKDKLQSLNRLGSKPNLDWSGSVV
ncbi:MAG: hypothetical protein CLLPBCKN_007232 [Chroococcidiopsis cubana SAG 39.79]|nr:hypothetical protein [Chroococcidiopsis cubana SAG 39.79]